MEWSNPIAVDLRMGGMDADPNCRSGGGPAKACKYGGALNYDICHGGSEIAWEVCIQGSSV